MRDYNLKTPLKLLLFQLPNQQLILSEKESKRRRETRKTRRKRKRKKRKKKRNLRKQRNPIAIVIEKFLLLAQSKIDIIMRDYHLV